MTSKLYLLRLQADKPEALALSSMLEEASFPESSAVSCYELEADSDVWEVAAYYPDEPPTQEALMELADLFGQKLPALSISAVEDENWVARVQAGLTPVQAGRFIIYGSHDADKVGHHPFSIQIDAGEAFGTAHHGTTRGCLELLDIALKQDFYEHVLDLGTGTGVLAIACAKVQGNEVFASDIDPVSCRITEENAHVNGVGNLIKTEVGAGFVDFAMGGYDAPYDLILANILAGPLAGMAQDFADNSWSGSRIILSGILNHQARMVEARFRNAGFVREQTRDIEGWTSFLLKKT